MDILNEKNMVLSDEDFAKMIEMIRVQKSVNYKELHKAFPHKELG
jgi:hypothetical protein